MLSTAQMYQFRSNKINITFGFMYQKYFVYDGIHIHYQTTASIENHEIEDGRFFLRYCVQWQNWINEKKMFYSVDKAKLRCTL